MKTSILDFIRTSGVISFRDIICALNLHTESDEASVQLAFLQMEGLVHYVPGKGYEAK